MVVARNMKDNSGNTLGFDFIKWLHGWRLDVFYLRLVYRGVEYDGREDEK